MTSSHFFALAGNLAFSSATIVYTSFSKKTSVYWVNTYKAGVAFAFGGLALFLFTGWMDQPGVSVLMCLISGFLGLCVADIFLLNSFTRIGPARGLMLFGFHPFYLSVLGYFLLGQPMQIQHFLGLLLMLGCLFSVSLERYREKGSWEFRGLALALAAVLIDGTGVIFARKAFDAAPGLPVLQATFVRAAGALLGFCIIAQVKPIKMIALFRKFSAKDRLLITAACFWGTFIALWLGFTAVKFGHLASISAINMSGPFFGGVFEHVIQRRMPSKYYWAALLFFCSGFYILVQAG